MKNLSAFLFYLALFACDGTVQGDVFIIKGSGEVSVFAGRAVAFISIAS